MSSACWEVVLDGRGCASNRVCLEGLEMFHFMIAYLTT